MAGGRIVRAVAAIRTMLNAATTPMSGMSGSASRFRNAV
jgi:hypothetical protein